MPTAKFYVHDTNSEGSPCWKGTTAPPSTTFETHETGQWLIQKTLTAGPNYEYSNGVIRYDTSNIPDDATITAAKIVMRFAQRVDADGTFNLEGEYYDFGGKPSTSADWVETVGSSIFTPVDLGTLATGSFFEFPLNDLSGINKSGITGFRFTLSSGTPSVGKNLLGVNSYSQNSQATWLEVTYTLGTTVFHVDVDAVTDSIRTDTSDPYEFTHTPNGTPDGVLVAVAQAVTAAPHAQSVSYGGQALSQVVAASCTSGEQGHVSLWFLGTGVPSGAQTVSVDLDSATADDIEVCCVTLVSNDGEDLEVLTSAAISNTATGTNGTTTLSYGGREGMAFSVHFSGLVTSWWNLRVPDNYEHIGFNDSYSSQVTKVCRQSVPGTSDFTAGIVQTTDDLAAAFVAITRIAALIDAWTLVAVDGDTETLTASSEDNTLTLAVLPEEPLY